MPANANVDTQSVQLTSVSCAGAERCAAIGGYDTSESFVGLLEALSGRTWTATETPLPVNADKAAHVPGATLFSASCNIVGRCVAVGTYTGSKRNSQALLETLSDGTWRATEAPLPADASPSSAAGLVAVSCHPIGRCIAVGYYTETNGHPEALADMFAGGTWKPTSVPLPAAANGAHALSQFSPGVSLNSVDCTNPGPCAAFGDYDGTDRREHDFLETLSGSTWTLGNVPVPGVAGTSFGVGLDPTTCASLGRCAAIGGYTDAAGHEHLLLEALSAGTWRATDAPLPAGGVISSTTYLESVACTSSGACFAVGAYTEAGTHRHNRALLETLPG